MTFNHICSVGICGDTSRVKETREGGGREHRSTALKKLFNSGVSQNYLLILYAKVVKCPCFRVISEMLTE